MNDTGYTPHSREGSFIKSKQPRKSRLYELQWHFFFSMFKRKDKTIMKLGGYEREDALRRVQGLEIIGIIT